MIGWLVVPHDEAIDNHHQTQGADLYKVGIGLPARLPPVATHLTREHHGTQAGETMMNHFSNGYANPVNYYDDH